MSVMFAVHLLRQLFYRNIAPRNIGYISPSMFPKGFHPVKPSFYQPGVPGSSSELLERAPAFTRTTAPPKYYFFNFGHAIQEQIEEKGEIMVEAFNKSHLPAPEMSDRHDAYKADIYALAQTMKIMFLEVRPT
jgi:hypothetical protein